MRKIFIIFLLAFLASVPVVGADISSLPWSTSFNTAGHCPEQTFSTSANVATVDCDGLYIYGDWVCETSGTTDITTYANYPGGAGGRGLRQRYGDNNGSTSSVISGSPDPTIDFVTPQNNFYIRFYMRLEAGMEISRLGAWKLFYMYGTGGADFIDSEGGYSLIRVGNDFVSTISTTWLDDIYPTGVSDGSWHCYEFHFNIPAGQAQFWLDGVSEGVASVNWGISDVNFMRFSENAKNSFTGNVCYYVDKDDIEISTSYIGPLAGGGDTTDPVVTITSPTSNTTYDNGSTQTVNIGGTASDDNAVSVVTWTCPTCTPSGGTATGTTSWNQNSIGLSNGDNVITVTAEDSSSNTSQDVLTVTYTPSGDTTDPTVTITTPTSSATYDNGSNSSIVLGGTASDDVVVSSVSWGCPSCTPSSGSASGTTSWTTQPITLAGGQNVFTVTATDSSENTGADVLTVTYTPASSSGAIGFDGGSNMSIGYAASGPRLQFIYSQQQQTYLLYDGFEDGTDDNWQCNYAQGGASIVADPVDTGTYALRMIATTGTNDGGESIWHCFGDNPGLGGTQQTDITIEGEFYFSSGYSWPSTDLKLWQVAAFESWGAPYPLANATSKPNTWAPYYIAISVDSSGEPFGQYTRADGLPGGSGSPSGVIWQNLVQNQGTADYTFTPATWTPFKIRLALNTPGVADGIFQMWLNDILVASYTNLNFRDSYTTYGWNVLIANHYANPSHSQTQSVTRDEIKLYVTP